MPFDANTPRLKATKDLFDASISLDPGKAATLLSKNFQCEVRGVANVAKLDKGGYDEMIRGLFARVTKLDVSIQRRRTHDRTGARSKSLSIPITSPRFLLTSHPQLILATDFDHYEKCIFCHPLLTLVHTHADF